MLRMHTALVLALGTIATSAIVGCSSPSEDAVASEESGLSETPKPRDGSTIQSPSVNPAKRYWGTRSIERLKRLGYLNAMEASVAARADGILANSPPNASIGVDELAVLESPEHSSSLFPDEKAVIPKLWKILEINDAPDVGSQNASLTPTIVENLPTAETKIPTTSRTAQRIQLTCDSDADPATLTSADIECAYADRNSYTPTEVAELRQLVTAIANAAAQPTHSMTVPAATTGASLFSSAGITITGDFVSTLGGSWRSGTTTAGVISVVPKLVLGAPSAGTSIVLIDQTTGVETDTAAGPLRTNTRLEVWSGGQRTAELDLVNAANASQPVPFGMPVVINNQTQVMSFTGSPTTGAYGLATTSTSKPTIPPRTYRIAGVADGRLHLFAQGYGRWITSSSDEVCYPVIDGTRALRSCAVMDTNNRPRATFVFALPGTPADSPAIAHTTGAFGDKVAVYPL
jgi:hypothetical protein